VAQYFLKPEQRAQLKEKKMAENTNELQVAPVQDQVETKVNADLDVEIELETAETSFTFTEARFA
jgi:hypothetical protein